MGLRLTEVRIELEDLQQQFELASGKACAAVLTHHPDFEIQEGWIKGPKRKVQGGQQNKLAEYRKERFQVIPGREQLPATDWVRWWELS